MSVAMARITLRLDGLIGMESQFRDAAGGSQTRVRSEVQQVSNWKLFVS